MGVAEVKLLNVYIPTVSLVLGVCAFRQKKHFNDDDHGSKSLSLIHI